MKQSAFGIASMVIGIVSLVFSCLGIGFLGILGFIFAIVAFMQKNKAKGTAIAGLITSIIAFLISFFVLIIGMSLFTDDMEKQISKDNDSTTHTEEPINEEIRIEIQKLYDKNDCVLSVVEGDNKHISIEINNSSNKNYEYSISAMAINGTMVSDTVNIASKEVPAKKKGIMQIEFDDKELEIGTIGYIDMIITAYNNEEYEKGFDTGVINLTTNHFKGERTFETDGSCYNKKGIIVIKNSIDTEKISYSIINENDFIVETTLENCSINGWAFEPGYSGHSAFDMVWSSTDGSGIKILPNSITTVDVDVSGFVKENNIDEISDFEFSLEILPDEDYAKEYHTKKIIFEN